MSYIKTSHGKRCEICGTSLGRGSARSKKKLCETCQRVQEVYGGGVQTS